MSTHLDETIRSLRTKIDLRTGPSHVLSAEVAGSARPHRPRDHIVGEVAPDSGEERRGS